MHATRWILAVCLLGICAGAWAAPDFDRIAPRETWAYVWVRDVPGLAEKMKQHSFYALWQEPSVQAFFDQAIARFNQELQKAEGEVGIKLQDVLGLFQGQVGFYLVGNPAQPEAGAGVVFIEVGERGAEARRLVEALLKLDADGAQAPRVTTETVTLKGVEVTQIYEGEDATPDAAFSVIDDTLILCNAAAMEQVIVRIQDPTVQSILDNPAYTNCIERVGLESDMTVFVYMEAIIDLVKQNDPQGELGRIIEGLGLDGLLAVAMGNEVRATESRGNVFVNMVPEPQGVLTLLTQEPGPLHGAASVPADVASFVTFRVDPVAAWNEFEKIMMVLDPQRMQQINMQLETTAQQINEPFDLRNDVLSVFGPAWSVYTRFEEPVGPQSQQVVVSADIPSKEAFGALWSKVQRIMPPLSQIRPEDYLGHDLYRLVPPQQAAQMPPGMPVPAFAITNERFVFSNDVENVQAALRRMGGQAADSLADEQAYRTGMRAVAAAQCTLMGFSNPEPQMRNLLNTLRGGQMAFLFGMMRSNKAAAEILDLFDFSQLPPNEIVLKHIVTSSSCAERVPGGLLLKSWSPAKPVGE
jgi:hypothetical protein